VSELVAPAYDPTFETCPCESPIEHAAGRCLDWKPDPDWRELARDRGERVELCSCEESLALRAELAALRAELATTRTTAALFEQRVDRALAIATAPARPMLPPDGAPSRLARVMGALRGEA
jgi:hypothetical protein